MQNECRKKYSQGIPQKEIANTGAGTLKFQKVFYIPLQDYKIPSHAKVDNPNKFILTLLFFLYIYSRNVKYNEVFLFVHVLYW